MVEFHGHFWQIFVIAVAIVLIFVSNPRIAGPIRGGRPAGKPCLPQPTAHLRHNRADDRLSAILFPRGPGGSLWRNRLARSAVNRKVGGSSPPRDGEAFLSLPGATQAFP
ncbi:uncharacterized protein LOC113168728 [Tachysurus ichikawai]